MEVNSQTYVIYYWIPSLGGSWNLEAWTLNEIESVKEALDWAIGEARGRRYQLLVSNPWAEDKEELIVLAGSDPTEGESQVGWVAVRSD